jgi:hypothetical protein
MVEARHKEWPDLFLLERPMAPMRQPSGGTKKEKTMASMETTSTSFEDDEDGF